jgi:hypothetical protein
MAWIAGSDTGRSAGCGAALTDAQAANASSAAIDDSPALIGERTSGCLNE